MARCRRVYGRRIAPVNVSCETALPSPCHTRPAPGAFLPRSRSGDLDRARGPCGRLIPPRFGLKSARWGRSEGGGGGEDEEAAAGGDGKSLEARSSRAGTNTTSCASR